jgi:uncharacterized protein (UPF0332 family)
MTGGSVRRLLGICNPPPIQRAPTIPPRYTAAVAEQASIYLDKALESLAGAASEFGNRRYNNAASRCYYSCFQAAISALQHEGIRPHGEQWGHAFVQAQFAEQLIRRRKRYVSDLRTVLLQTLALRHAADYRNDWISQRDALRALRLT